MEKENKTEETSQLPRAIVLDIDDTICDFLGQLCLLHNRLHNTHVTRADVVGYPLKGEDELEDIHGNIVRDANIEKTFRKYEPHGLYAVLPVFPEAKQAIEIMQELGYKIILMTARPKQYEEQTKLSLMSNNIKYDRLIFDYKKADRILELKEEFDIIMFADDRASTVKNVNNNCSIKYPILINKPHNENASTSQKITRVDDLLEVVKFLKEEK